MKDDRDRVSSIEDDPQSGSGVSRRQFLKISGVAAAVPMVIGPTVIKVAGQDVEMLGPGPVPMSFTINGKKYTANLEPRVTLLDALREHLEITGPKRVCDRGTCGACTVMLDDHIVYSCTTLAIEAQGHKITTTEGLGGPGHLHPVQQAFWDNDAQQCGFCTPGFVMATKAFLDKHPHPTSKAEIAHGLGGNLCRCGTYDGIKHAVAQVSGHTAAAPKKAGA